MKTLLLALALLPACDFNPNKNPQAPEHDGPAFYIHGYPVFSVIYYGNHCFLVDFHDPKVRGVDGYSNKDRYMFACSGH